MMRMLLLIFVLANLVSGCSADRPMKPTCTCWPDNPEDSLKRSGDRVFFGFDSASLDDESRATLIRQANWMQAHRRVSVLIAGNCDERGTAEYNLALGQKRAAAARSRLIAGGVAADRIATISYGKDRPAVAESNEAAWARNRNAITSVRTGELSP